VTVKALGKYSEAVDRQEIMALISK
jgi:hypothetical protein